MGAEVRNYTKVKCLYYLEGLAEPGEFRSEHNYWATIPDIAREAEVNTGSLYVLMPRWERYGYVQSKYFSGDCMSDSRPHWVYKIASRGRSYLKRLDRWYARCDEAREIVYGEEGTVCSPHTRIRAIAWHTPPAKRVVTIIEWPFNTANDARWQYYGFLYSDYQVENIDVAAQMAKALFGIEPTDICLKAALGIQNHFVNEALKEQSSVH